MEPKPVLAFDCATMAATIALAVGGRVTSRTIIQGRQAAELVSMIDELMTEAGLSYSQLGAIVTTVGPGSFTGVRIGLAALHGLVLAAPVPVKTMTSLEALAWEAASRADAPERFITALRAGKGEAYAQEFTRAGNKPTAASEIYLVAEEKSDWALPCFSNVQPTESPLYLPAPNASLLSQIAHLLPTTSLGEALPCYIRAPDAKLPTAPAWLA